MNPDRSEGFLAVMQGSASRSAGRLGLCASLTSLVVCTAGCQPKLAPPSRPASNSTSARADVQLPPTLPNSISTRASRHLEPPGPVTVAAPSSAPASPPPTPTTSESWEKRLNRLYSSYEEGASRRREVYRELFASRLQFISRRSVTLEEAISNMDAFFLSHPNPRYNVRQVESTSARAARASVEARWDEACPSDWSRDDFGCFRHLLLDIATEADELGKIHQLLESKGHPFRFKVDAPSIDAYLIPQSGCDRATADLQLPQGTVVEATGRYIQSLSCGPCETLLEFQYQGGVYWAAQMTCTRTYDTETGPHTEIESPLLKLED